MCTLGGAVNCYFLVDTLFFSSVKIYFSANSTIFGLTGAVSCDYIFSLFSYLVILSFIFFLFLDMRLPRFIFTSVYLFYLGLTTVICSSCIELDFTVAMDSSMNILPRGFSFVIGLIGITFTTLSSSSSSYSSSSGWISSCTSYSWSSGSIGAASSSICSWSCSSGSSTSTCCSD